MQNYQKHFCLVEKIRPFCKEKSVYTHPRQKTEPNIRLSS